MFNFLTKLFKPKTDTIPEMVKYIKKKNFKIHQQRFIYDKQEFIEANIDEYNKVLSYIIDSDDQHTHLSIKSITPYNLQSTTLVQWLSGTKYIRQDADKIFFKWLELVEAVYYKYIVETSDPTNTFAFNNSRKIKPYIINIENILRNICSQC